MKNFSLFTTFVYHPDLMVSAVLFKGSVVGSIHDSEIFTNGLQIFWN